MNLPVISRAALAACGCAAVGMLLPDPAASKEQPPAFERARANAVRFERAVQAADRVLRAWMQHADDRTLLLPDRPLADDGSRVYTPHNSGADLYPYLILTAHLTDPDLYHGRLVEMLRNEVRYTTVQRSIPANLTFAPQQLGQVSFFGAAEYAKDGLIAVTEYLGRTPWFYRMADMIADAMTDAPIASRFGALPADDAETNGDYLQALVRLAAMTGDQRFLSWARRIGDAYMEEVLPGSGGVPGHTWNFETHTGAPRLRLRDHGNETIVGLVMLFALEHQLGSPRAHSYRPAIQRMLDRERLLLHLDMARPRRIQFDFARHRRVLNFAQNYVRLNEFPEWFSVNENHLYRLHSSGSEAAGHPWLGSELIAGVEMAPGDWILERAGEPPYGRPARTP
jgi:hypothetical protein